MPITTKNSIASPLPHHTEKKKKKKKTSGGMDTPFPVLRIFLDTNTGYIMIYANITQRSLPFPGAY